MGGRGGLRVSAAVCCQDGPPVAEQEAERDNAAESRHHSKCLLVHQFPNHNHLLLQMFQNLFKGQPNVVHVYYYNSFFFIHLAGEIRCR